MCWFIYQNNLIHYDDNMYLTADSLIEINNMTALNNTLRKATVKLYGFDQMYIDKDLIKDKLYPTIDQFNKR